jgi:head-tail adaptor
MSINSKQETYLLKCWAKTYDELGTPIETWADVAEVRASVNYNNTTEIINGIAYKTTTPTAITDYNDFNLKEKYQLVNNRHKFNIEGINQEGRKTQLVLKEVLI